jgi:hypothetical protein
VKILDLIPQNLHLNLFIIAKTLITTCSGYKICTSTGCNAEQKENGWLRQSVFMCISVCLFVSCRLILLCVSLCFSVDVYLSVCLCVIACVFVYVSMRWRVGVRLFLFHVWVCLCVQFIHTCVFLPVEDALWAGRQFSFQREGWVMAISNWIVLESIQFIILCSYRSYEKQVKYYVCFLDK